MSGQVDSSDLQSLIKELQGGPESRKLLRQASRVSLEVFNEATAEAVGKLPLNPSGKKWRKTLKKKGSYTYKSKNSSRGKFEFWTGIDYRKPNLRISHLVERGFTHPDGKKVTAHWYRRTAFQRNRASVMKTFERKLNQGIDIIAATGKAPGLKTLRNLS